MKRTHNLKIELKSSSSSEQTSPHIDSDGKEYFDYYDIISINNITYGEVSSKRCGRITMEDRFQAIADFDGKQKQFYFGVFDGHGGSYVAKILQEQLHYLLKNHKQFEIDLEVAIQESFKQMNSDILSQQRLLMKDGGSTALCVINAGKEVFIINVGDSACVLVSNNLDIRKLSQEHKPDRQDESQRIVNNNGYVLTIKNQARINGELAVSRSFGDPKYIEHGLTAIPEITRLQLDESSKYLILATDGFWDVITVDELQFLIKKWQNMQQPDGLSQFLLDAAQKQHTNYKKDNMTIIIIDLNTYYKNLN